MKLKTTAIILIILGILLYGFGIWKFNASEQKTLSPLVWSSVGSMMLFIGIGLWLSKLFKK